MNNTSSTASERSLPLTGVRILDLTRVLAGPWAAQLLADLGAEVIKIERPLKGDEARTYGGPYLHDANGAITADNAFYLTSNRGKKSVEADFSTPEGKAIVSALACNCDVLMENFRVGTMARYGLDYETLAAANSKLIYCSITGFGQDGPYCHRPGYDPIFQGMGGLMSVTGPKDGQPGSGPVKVGPSIVDILAGLFASNAIIAALHGRAAGLPGQHIDISLLDSVVAAMSHYAQIYLVSGEVPPRRGTEGNGGFPSQMMPCADGHIMVVAGNDRQFRLLAEAIGLADLAEDPRYITNNQRLVHRDALTNILFNRFRQRRKAEWLAALDAAGVPCGPINDLSEVFADSQVLLRGMMQEVKHPVAGTVKLVGNPIKYSKTPLGNFQAPPTLGQHTRDVLQNLLGYTDGEIEAYELSMRANADAGAAEP